MTIWILNSAVLPAGEYGTYTFAPATWDALRDEIHRHGVGPDHAIVPTCVVSRVGYPETAALIERRCGLRDGDIPLSREASAMQPGDVAYIVRLRYRIADPATKGQATNAPNEAWEVARMVRVDAIALCPLHAAAPELAALLREEYDDTTESTGRADRERRARALLARIDEAGGER